MRRNGHIILGSGNHLLPKGGNVNDSLCVHLAWPLALLGPAFLQAL